MLTLLWLAAFGLIGIVCWLLIRWVVDVVLTREQRADHERFWGDGATADGSWAHELHGTFGPAVTDPDHVKPTAEEEREIHPRDSLGRHRDPARVRAGANRVGMSSAQFAAWLRKRNRKGTRLPEAAGAPQSPRT